MSTSLLLKLIQGCHRQSLRTNILVKSCGLCTQIIRFNSVQQRVFPENRRIPILYKDQIEDAIQANYDKIAKFAAVLKCDTAIIEKLARMDTRIVTYFSFDNVSEKLKLLSEYKYDPSEIAMNPCVICLSISELRNRLQMLETVRPYHSSLNLICKARTFFTDKIRDYQHEMSLLKNYPSKLHFFAEKLDCSRDDILDMIDKGHLHLLTRSPSTIDQLVNLILENGFTTEDIQKYPLSLALSIPEAKKRFETVRKHGVVGHMTLLSVLISKKAQFTASVKAWVTQLSYMEGYENCNDILKRRLKASDEEVALMHDRSMLLKNFSPKKLQTSLDVLLKEMNIDPRDIIQNSRVMYYSLDRLRKRHLVFQKAGLNSSRAMLGDLCLSERKFASKYSHLITES